MRSESPPWRPPNASISCGPCARPIGSSVVPRARPRALALAGRLSIPSCASSVSPGRNDGDRSSAGEISSCVRPHLLGVGEFAGILFSATTFGTITCKNDPGCFNYLERFLHSEGLGLEREERQRPGSRLTS